MKIISREFTVDRTKATRDAALILAGPPFNFVWEFKTNVQWSDDLVLLDQLESAEILARTEWRNAAEV